MKKLSQNLILLTILLSGTQIVNLSISNLTIFQIILIITIICCIVNLFFFKKIFLGKYLFFGIVYGLSSVLAYFISTNPLWAKSYLLLGLMTALLVLFVPVYFKRNDIKLFEKTLIRSQYIVFPFSIYSIYMFYFKEGIPSYIELFAKMYINLDKDFLRRAQAASQIRLTLPYSTPPVLSIVMAMCITILLVDKEIFSNWIRKCLILSYSVVLIFTGSRTGIIALIIVQVAFFKLKNLKSIKKKNFYLIPVFLLIVSIIASKFLSSIYITKFINRFTVIKFSSLMKDRHFLVPLDGIIIWISSVKNFLLGIGFGSSINMVGVHTFLPPYFLNSFITLIVERGMFGLGIVIILINLAISLISKIKNMKKEEKAITYAYIVGLVSCIFYEGINSYFLIFIISISFFIDMNIKK